MPGSQTNGKWRIPVLGISKANCWKGLGAENMPVITTWLTINRQTQFQMSSQRLLIFPLFQPKYAMNGAVKPASISKLRPLKVIDSGTKWYTNK